MRCCCCCLKALTLSGFFVSSSPSLSPTGTLHALFAHSFIIMFLLLLFGNFLVHVEFLLAFWLPLLPLALQLWQLFACRRLLCQTDLEQVQQQRRRRRLHRQRKCEWERDRDRERQPAGRLTLPWPWLQCCASMTSTATST